MERYEIIKEVGRGRWGRVYKACEKGAGNREVALKTIPLDEIEAEQLIHLKKEFEVLKRLSHTGIVSVFDFGIDSHKGVAFIAEEYIDGSPSGHERLSEKELLGRLSSLARALHFIHRHHIYHGDIKPENIIILEKGDGIKIIDFGLSHGRADGKWVKGEISGTLNYLAPERFGGGPPSRQSDLYALGVTLYEWATGCLPFAGKPLSGLIPDIMSSQPPSPRKINRDLSPPISDLILSCLQKNAADRPRMANDLIRELNSRLHLSIPLEKEGASDLWWKSAGLVGREALLDTIIDASKGEGFKWLTLMGEPGLGKSSFLLNLQSRLQMAGLNPVTVEVKGMAGAGSYQQLVEGVLPATILIDDFDLLPHGIQESLCEKARVQGDGLWLWTMKSKEGLSPTFWQGTELHVLAPLRRLEVTQLIEGCLDLEGLPDSLVDFLYNLSGGRPARVIEALTILMDTAWDTSGPLKPQLSKIALSDYIQGDVLTGFVPSKVESLDERYHRLIGEVSSKISKFPEDGESRHLYAQLLVQVGNYQEFLRSFDMKGEPYLYLSVLNRLGRYEETIKFCDQLDQSGKADRDPITLDNLKGTALYFLGMRDQATRSFEKAMHAVRDQGQWDRLSTCINNLANVVSHGSNPIEAVPLYNESLEFSKKGVDVLGEGRALANLGHVYHLIQDYRRAMEYYYAGINLYRRVRYLGEMAHIKGNLGGLYLELGAWSQAEESILESLKLALERDRKYQVHTAHLLYGNLMRRRGKFSEAKNYYEKAKRGFDALNAREDISRVLLSVARLSLSEGNLSQADDILNEISGAKLSLRHEAEYKFLRAEFLLARGRPLGELESLVRASEEMYRKLKAPDDQLLCLIFLDKIYHKFNKIDLSHKVRREGFKFFQESKGRIPEDYWEDYKRLVPQWCY